MGRVGLLAGLAAIASLLIGSSSDIGSQLLLAVFFGAVFGYSWRDVRIVGIIYGLVVGVFVTVAVAMVDESIATAEHPQLLQTLTMGKYLIPLGAYGITTAIPLFDEIWDLR